VGVGVMLCTGKETNPENVLSPIFLLDSSSYDKLGE
jgi:hypothetical protein